MRKIALLIMLIVPFAVAQWLSVIGGKSSCCSFYVDPSGNDSCDGTSPALGSSGHCAFATISKVNGTTLTAGQSVGFKAGGTWREQLTVPSSGSVGSPITFTSYGSGAAPIISGSNVITGWAANSGTVSGSVSQANWRLSQVNGTAFVDFSAVNALTSYLGDQITITDHSSHHLVGYIKAAGSGETYGSELMANTGFANTTGVSVASVAVSSVAGGQSGNALQLTTTASSGSIAWENVTTTNGALYLFQSYLKSGTCATPAMTMQENGGSYNFLESVYDGAGSWTNYSIYVTADMTSLRSAWNPVGSNGCTQLSDTASTKQVTAPSSTGVTITSTSGGSTYNWTSMDSGFNLNDSSGYTYSINASLANVYQVSLATQPKQLFLGGSLATLGTSAAALTQHQWFWAGGVLYVYESGGNPDTVPDAIEASQRNNAVNTNSQSYLTFRNLSLTKANAQNLYVVTAWTGILADHITTSQSYNAGIQGWASSAPSSGLTLTYITCSATGIAGGPGGVTSPNCIDVGGTSSTNYPTQILIQNSTSTGDYSGFECDYFSDHCVVDHSIVTGTTSGNGFNCDGCRNSQFTYDIAYNNTGLGVQIFRAGNGWNPPIGNSVYNSTLYNNHSDIELDQTQTNTVLENNILASPVSLALSMDNTATFTGLTINYNLYYAPSITYPFYYGGSGLTFSGWKAASSQDANSPTPADPLFTSVGTGDFTLQVGSPAINAGVCISGVTTCPTNIGAK